MQELPKKYDFHDAEKKWRAAWEDNKTYAFDKDKKYCTVEANATGQLGRLLRSEYGIEFEGHIGRIDGLPLTAQYIRSRLS
mgnify:CR=1 FL=1